MATLRYSDNIIHAITWQNDMPTSRQDSLTLKMPELHLRHYGIPTLRQMSQWLEWYLFSLSGIPALQQDEIEIDNSNNDTWIIPSRRHSGNPTYINTQWLRIFCS